MSEPHYENGPVTLWHGDCIEVMRELPEASAHAVVTDPPYGLEFMGREWDGADGFRRSLNPADAGRESVFGRTSRTSPEYRAGHLFEEWCETWAREAFRVLKPGGHLLAFGGTRTFHRLTSGVEDAGFEIRDSIAWLYGSGFPKSLDVSKAIDKAAGAEREVVGTRTGRAALPRTDMRGGRYADPSADRHLDLSAITAPATREAEQWHGWGTALKPAFEPIVVARKPLASTVAANVIAHGAGALNIDASRIPAIDPEAYAAKGASVVGLGSNRNGAAYGEWKGTRADSTSDLGRWPANVILDESQASTLAEARYFYTAKADSAERPSVNGVQHPTVKPLDLMQWLLRLVTPKGGTVLEPFAGSGTTVEACLREGFNCIAIEREAGYLPLILQRVRKPHDVGFDFDWEDAS